MGTRRTTTALGFVAMVAACAMAQVPETGPGFRPVFQKGVCVTHNHSQTAGYGSEPARRTLEEIRSLGANAVSLSPVGYVFNLHDPRVFGYLGENETLTPDHVRRMIRDAKAAGLKVFLNPHLWVGLYGAPGEWRGNIAMRTDAEWDEWFRNYGTFIRFWARVAQEEGVDLFSVGSELVAATKAKPDAWRRLIREVRGIYRGPCTYASNWSGELDHITFWDDLEYLAISAYYPVGPGDRVERLARAAATRAEVQALSEKWAKPVLFAEIGYRSVAGAGEKPAEWKIGDPAAPDPDEQRLNFEVFFETYWNEPWFFGGYVWSWFSDPDFKVTVPNDYQIRGRPASAVVSDYFQRGPVAR